MTQMSLGIALLRLSEHTSDTTRLTQAVTAFQQTLLEFPRERVPLLWAMTQRNLGLALPRLSERASDTTRLTRAVTAFQQTLLENRRLLSPLKTCPKP
jgi:hypothetical protein